MTNKKLFCLLIAIITLTTIGCESNEKPVDSILDATSLRNGSVSMYNVKDKSGKVIKVLQNHVIEETAEMLFVQQYSTTESEEIIRVKMSPNTLNLDYSEIVTTKSEDGGETMPKQEALSSVERSGKNYFLSSTHSGKKVNSNFFNDSLVMEQEVMIYLLNCYPFETFPSSSIHFVNVRNQKEGTETIVVEGKETKTYNKADLSVYKVNLVALGGTAYYMEEKPHLLVEADFPSFTIVLVDWNGI